MDDIIGIMLIVLVGYCFSALLSPPSPEEIQMCIEVTNYTAERCEWEMTR